MIFKFEALDKLGKEITNVVDAENAIDAEYKIRQMGYFVTKLNKVKENKDNIKIVYTDRLPHNYWKIAFFALLAMVIVLSFISMARGQESNLQTVEQAFSQTVTIKYQGHIRSFRRESYDCITWSDWIEWAPMRKDEKAKSFKPLQVNQQATNKIIGQDILKWLSKRPQLSGYYNFSNNSNYDWEEYAGDNYGTFSIDMSKIRFPVRRDK